jgi:hypothetical protein
MEEEIVAVAEYWRPGGKEKYKIELAKIEEAIFLVKKWQKEMKILK